MAQEAVISQEIFQQGEPKGQQAKQNGLALSVGKTTKGNQPISGSIASLSRDASHGVVEQIDR